MGTHIPCVSYEVAQKPRGLPMDIASGSTPPTIDQGSATVHFVTGHLAATGPSVTGSGRFRDP